MGNKDDLIFAALSAAKHAADGLPDAVAAWLEDNVDPETGYVVDSSLSIEGAAADAKAVGTLKTEISKMLPANLNTTAFSAGSISSVDGDVKASSSGLVHTGYINIDGLDKLVYSRVHTTSSTAVYGMAFYETMSSSTFISGQRAVINAGTTHAELSSVDVPTNAKYARFSWFEDLGEFELYDSAQYNSAYLTIHDEEINELQTDVAKTKISINGATINKTLDFNFTDGKRIRSVNGAYQGSSDFSAYKANQNFVSVDGYTHVLITMLQTQEATENGIAFYSSASEASYVSGMGSIVGEDAGGVEKLIEIPANAKYMRTTYWVDSSLPEGADAFACTVLYIGLNERVGNLEKRVGTQRVFNMRSLENVNIISNMQAGHGYTNPLSSGNEPEDDTENYIFGTQSVKFSRAGQARISTDGIDFRDKIISVTLNVGTIDANDEIYMYLSDAAGFSRYKAFILFKKTLSDQFQPGAWGNVSVSTNGGRNVGNVNMEKIKYIRFSATPGVVYNIQSVGYRESGGQHPCISFTFDDGWSEVMDGAKIMGKYGIPGTAYIFERCQLTTNQLKSLRFNYGWDIEMHGANTFTSMTEEEIVAELTSLQHYIVTNGLGRGEHLAYPGGQNNPTVVDVVSRFCKSARTISHESSSTETIPSPMPFNLRAVSAIGASGETVNSVKKHIDRAIARNGWLILVFHRIGYDQTSMFCSPEDLEEICSYAVASGADIKTVADMWERN